MVEYVMRAFRGESFEGLFEDGEWVFGFFQRPALRLGGSLVAEEVSTGWKKGDMCSTAGQPVLAVCLPDYRCRIHHRSGLLEGTK